MSDKFSAVKNPLTIIAIFSGIAEISGTAVLPLVAAENQKLFIWFLMIFPTYLVSLFFFTLHKKPSALYAPSDFTDEGNYMATISQLGIKIRPTPNQAPPNTTSKIDEPAVNVINEDGAPEFSDEDTEVTKESDVAEGKDNSNQGINIPLPELAKVYTEKKLGIKFDVVKSEMENDLGNVRFDGVYYPPFVNGKLSGNIIFFEAKVYKPNVLKYIERIVSLTNETWKHLKNIQMIVTLIVNDGDHIGIRSELNINRIKEMAQFPLVIDIIQQQELIKNTNSSIESD